MSVAVTVDDDDEAARGGRMIDVVLVLVAAGGRETGLRQATVPMIAVVAEMMVMVAQQS